MKPVVMTSHERAILASLLALLVLLFAASVSHAQASQEIEVPEGSAPTLDGEISPGEWDGAAEVPLEGLPLRAQAMHDGEDLYLVFEVLTPSTGETIPLGNGEVFVVWDDGDREFYEEGDGMALCSSEGCEFCHYTAQFAFTCEEQLPGAADSVIEVQVPMDIVVGQVVLGAILDNVEYTSESFGVAFLIPEPVAEEIEEPEEEVVPVAPAPTPEEQPVGVSEAEIGITGAGWVALLAAALALFAFSIFLLWWLRARRKARETWDAARGVGRRVVSGAAREAREEQERRRKAREAAAKARQKAAARRRTLAKWRRRLGNLNRVRDNAEAIADGLDKGNQPRGNESQVAQQAEKLAEQERQLGQELITEAGRLRGEAQGVRQAGQSTTDPATQANAEGAAQGLEAAADDLEGIGQQLIGGAVSAQAAAGRIWGHLGRPR